MVLVLTGLIAALILAAAAAWGAGRIARELRGMRHEAARTRTLQVLTLLMPAARAVRDDPRALLVWQPVARLARRLFADEFAALDRGGGPPFPFGADAIQEAHGRWTSDWLSWERKHDAEYKLKAAAIEHEAAASGDSRVLRARLDAVEGEKLERYQRRYEEYVTVARALQALIAEMANEHERGND